jgi:O-acetyl-ADP-ribose deacetylase (regulator of RNase III)
MPELVLEPLRIGRSTVQLLRGDITQLEVDAFVYYARADLALGTGMGTAISQRGGASIQKELGQLGPLEVGQVVVSQGGKLKARFIVHAVGPKFNEPDTEGKLRRTVVNALKAAEEKGVKRIALLPMGAGFYMVPLDLCARVMIEAIQSYLQGPTNIEEVILCVMDSREWAPFHARLTAQKRSV